MDKHALLQFLETCGLGVLSSLEPEGGPQSALVGMALTPELEMDCRATPSYCTVTSPCQPITKATRGSREIFANFRDFSTVLSTELGAYYEVYFRKFTDGPSLLK